MDTAIEPPNRKKLAAAVIVGGGVLLLCGFGTSVVLHRYLAVPESEIATETVDVHELPDQIELNAKADPLQSMDLDAVESGRVEEIFAQDGALVKNGEPLFRLSNPERQLEVLQRRSEVAQQISNLSTLQVQFELDQSDRRRRLSAASFAAKQSRIKYDREAQLASSGFISSAATRDSADATLQLEHEIIEESERVNQEVTVQKHAIAQVQSTLKDLEQGLAIANSSLEAFLVRAPMNGQLTDFHLKLGEAVKVNEHLGRIDDPTDFRLLADTDEFYLGRVKPGISGAVERGTSAFPVRIERIYPQVKNGKFLIELRFVGPPPQEIQPGQNLPVALRLGAMQKIVSISNHTFPVKENGVEIYVINPDGASATLREVRLGRQSADFVEVISGLSAGERIVTSDYARFKAARTFRIRVS